MIRILFATLMLGTIFLGSAQAITEEETNTFQLPTDKLDRIDKPVKDNDDTNNETEEINETEEVNNDVIPINEAYNPNGKNYQYYPNGVLSRHNCVGIVEYENKIFRIPTSWNGWFNIGKWQIYANPEMCYYGVWNF